MCLIWFLFYYFDVGSYIDSKYFPTNFCLLISIGFAVRAIGNVSMIEIGYMGGFIIFYAIYKNLKTLMKPATPNK